MRLLFAPSLVPSRLCDAVGLSSGRARSYPFLESRQVHVEQAFKLRLAHMLARWEVAVVIRRAQDCVGFQLRFDVCIRELMREVFVASSNLYQLHCFAAFIDGINRR